MILYLVLVAFAAGSISWLAAKRSNRREVAEYNEQLQSELNRKNLEADEELQKAKAYQRKLEDWSRDATRSLDEQEAELRSRRRSVEELETKFKSGFLKGRKWLVGLIIEADKARDEELVQHLRFKAHKAEKAAETVQAISAERRELKRENLAYKYQLASLKEYFPFIEEYEEVIFDERICLANRQNATQDLDEADPVLKFVQKEEYDKLPPAQRNQRALDSYLRNMSEAGIGRLFELFIGYSHEMDGWDVEYHGILKGYEDLGRDLICRKHGEVKLIQAKCWSNKKVIREKHIFQLYGTKCLLELSNPERSLFKPKVEAFLMTTTGLSPVAAQAADYLGIKHEQNVPFRKQFPMIKCNINQQTGEKIYHLPFDQQYNRTKIVPSLGERYVATTAEAESLGFRRAYRHKGPF